MVLRGAWGFTLLAPSQMIVMLRDQVENHWSLLFCFQRTLLFFPTHSSNPEQKLKEDSSTILNNLIRSISQNDCLYATLLDTQNLKKEKFILAQGFSPRSFGCKAETAWWRDMCTKSCSSHGGHEAESKDRSCQRVRHLGSGASNPKQALTWLQFQLASCLKSPESPWPGSLR